MSLFDRSSARCALVHDAPLHPLVRGSAGTAQHEPARQLDWPLSAFSYERRQTRNKQSACGGSLFMAGVVGRRRRPAAPQTSSVSGTTDAAARCDPFGGGGRATASRGGGAAVRAARRDAKADPDRHRRLQAGAVSHDEALAPPPLRARSTADPVRSMFGASTTHTHLSACV